MKMTSVRSQDQRKMLQVTSHIFPNNTWIHKITKKKESNKCDLCKTFWLVEDRFTTEKDVPEQDPYETLSPVHTDQTLENPCQFLTQKLITEPDPRVTGPVGLPRMEIHVHFWIELSTDDLERITDDLEPNRWFTISKYHEGCDMEYIKKSRDGTYPYTRRVKTGPGVST